MLSIVESVKAPSETSSTDVDGLLKPADGTSTAMWSRRPLLVAAVATVAAVGLVVAAIPRLGGSASQDTASSVFTHTEDDGDQVRTDQDDTRIGDAENQPPTTQDTLEAPAFGPEQGPDDRAQTGRDAIEALLFKRRLALLADPPGNIDQARSLWAAEGPTDYRFTLQVLPSGRDIYLDIEVIAGEGARRLEPLPTPDWIDAPVIEPEWVATVEQLFALADDASPAIIAQFDPSLGFPTSFRLDPDPERLGDELLFRVRDLASIADIEAAERYLQSWVPPSIPIPGDMPWAGEPDKEQRFHQLIDTGERVVGLIESGRSYCVLTLIRDPQSEDVTSGSRSGCTSALNLVFEGLTDHGLMTTSNDSPASFFAVLPASHHDQPWAASVISDVGYEVYATNQSVLVAFDAGPTSPATVTIDCACGDLSFAA